MKINMGGTTRIVFVFKNIVVKIPKFTYSWEHFLKGLIANIGENKTWKYNSGKHERGRSHLLCPVLWCSWGGWILVMKRADVGQWIREVIDMPESPDETEKMYSRWIVAGFGGDDKADSYGYLNGHLVKVDYA